MLAFERAMTANPKLRGPATGDEPVGATSRIGANLHSPSNQAGVVAVVVTDGDQVG